MDVRARDSLTWIVVTLSFAAACGGGGGFPDARPIDSPPPNGTFTLSWSVTDTNNQNITCDQIGAQSVSVNAHNRAFLGGNNEVFGCSTGTGQSQGLFPGVYDFDFELDNNMGTIMTAPSQHGLTISAGQDTVLAPLSFAVPATGAVALSMSSGRAGGNCGATGAGGAGITSTTITLVHATGGACEPQTLTISAGATQPAGNYTINCTTPTVGPCIEHDQTLSASPVPSDNYAIHIRANVGATTCWTNDDTFAVPPLGATVTRAFNLAFATGTPGC